MFTITLNDQTASQLTKMVAAQSVSPEGSDGVQVGLRVQRPTAGGDIGTPRIDRAGALVGVVGDRIMRLVFARRVLHLDAARDALDHHLELGRAHV